jgi:hypothetical protein
MAKISNTLSYPNQSPIDSGDYLIGTAAGSSPISNQTKTFTIGDIANFVNTSSGNVSSIIAGTGISVDQATGNVTVSSTITDTTYDLASAQSTNDVDVTLTGSDASVDTVKFVAGTNVTLTDNGSNQITIDAAGGGGGISGSGTLNQIPMFTPDGTTIGDSIMKQSGTPSNPRIEVGNLSNGTRFTNVAVNTQQVFSEYLTVTNVSQNAIALVDTLEVLKQAEIGDSTTTSIIRGDLDIGSTVASTLDIISATTITGDLTTESISTVWLKGNTAVGESSSTSTFNIFSRIVDSTGSFGTEGQVLAAGSNQKLVWTGSGGGGNTYYTYTALISQTGTTPITIVSELNNNIPNIGTLNLARTSSGEYTITSTGTPFTANKTIVFINGGSAENNHDIAWEAVSTSQIKILTHNSDDKLTNASLEIRVYA